MLNIERDRPMSWFLQQKDLLTIHHPDMSEKMVHKRISRKCGVDLEHLIRSRCIDPCSKDDYINSMEYITSRTKIGRSWYKTTTDNKTSGKPIPRGIQIKTQDRAPLKYHKCGIKSNLAKNCTNQTAINEMELEKNQDTKEDNEFNLKGSD
ncbi:hypothetical protein O181_081330 [Austropuccinia psidii MF-1]|uniref:Uncharacterized protein n=1 Tax=Austropuccinia psidii MF-1 TaxID=1389203 RepID=A0A9Q3IJS8_9BASI|nr:hypothetical protein [Austropuccinia psidii MF-1]